MSDLYKKLKRQIEILGFALQKTQEYKKLDCEIQFGCNIATIERDLKTLRDRDIDIHSTKRGIKVDTSIQPDVLRELIFQYFGLASTSIVYDRSIEFLVARLKEKALVNLVILQRSIERKRMVVLDYERIPGNVEKGKCISPLMLFQGDQEWRLLAVRSGNVKQYLVSKIKHIEATDKPCEDTILGDLHGLVNSSWNSWISSDTYWIKLELSKKGVELFGHRQFTLKQQLKLKKKRNRHLRSRSEWAE